MPVPAKLIPGGPQRPWPSNAAPTGGATAPGAPTGVTGTNGDGSSVVSWAAPSSNGGSAITDYIVEQSVSPFTTWVTAGGGTVSTSTSQTVTGLTNGVGYRFRVYAQNANGLSAASAASATVTPAVSSSSNPSGFSPPTAASITNANGDTFTLKYVEDFERAVSEGTATLDGTASPFDNLYGVQAANKVSGQGTTTISTYPSNYDDTSNRGHYDPAILSVAAGSSILRKNVHYEAGWPRGASLLPRLANLSGMEVYGGSTRDVWGGRFEIVWRSPSIQGYKIAWLLWPLSNTRQTATGIDADGELDYPECDLYNNDGIKMYVHSQGQKTGTSTEQVQVQIKNPPSTGATVSGSANVWHKTTFEWVPGTIDTSTPNHRSYGGYIRVYCDDVFQQQVSGPATATATVPAGQMWIPAAPMHWSIQTETNLSGDTIPTTAQGYIEIDYIAFWKYERGSRSWVDPD